MFAEDSLRSMWAQLRSGRRLEFSGRVWALIVGILVGFVILIEVVARVNHLRGPLDLLATDLVGRPQIGEIKIAGMLLALVCMPSRMRLPVVGAAVALELAWNTQRLIVGNAPTVGNGILFALIGTATFAGWRLRGRERAGTLKAVGLGLLLIVMGRVGDVWLVLSSRANPNVLDEYVELADRALGSPSWAIGSVVSGTPWLTEVLSKVYVYLPVAAAVIAFFQLRNSARDGFPRHHIVRTFLLIGLIGPVIYFLFPVVGPTYAFGHELLGADWQDVWPQQLPVIGDPAAHYYNQSVARNCMPSLHTAWAMCIFLHGWRGPALSKVFGTFWLICTTGATLGFGFHYAIDVLAGAIFTLTLEAALTRPELGWSRHRLAVVVFGTAAFSGLLLATRYLAVEMSDSGVLGGLALIATVLAVAAAFLTVEMHPGRDRIPAGEIPAEAGPMVRRGREWAAAARTWGSEAWSSITREAKKAGSTKL
ncbi:phosphatase PAP2 family protein [Gordonia cholesterolivorans]